MNHQDRSGIAEEENMDGITAARFVQKRITTAGGEA
jgi:hypothetical protein